MYYLKLKSCGGATREGGGTDGNGTPAGGTRWYEGKGVPKGEHEGAWCTNKQVEMGGWMEHKPAGLGGMNRLGWWTANSRVGMNRLGGVIGAVNRSNERYLSFFLFSAHGHRQLSEYSEQLGGREQAGKVLGAVNESNEVALIFFIFLLLGQI
jgi:hypothetical protein